MGMVDEVCYRLRMPLDGWSSTRFAVRDYLSRDQPLGHGLTDIPTAPKLYFWRGPWWLRPVTDLMDAADIVTGHQFCSANMDAQDRLLARHATRTDIPIDPVELPRWSEFVSGPDRDWEGFGPYQPPGADETWWDVFGPYWFCTGCGVLSGSRRPEQHGVCTHCGTAMLPRGGVDDELSDALGELTEYELALEPEPDAYYCAEHDRHLPCRPCMREET